VFKNTKKPLSHMKEARRQFVSITPLISQKEYLSVGISTVPSNRETLAPLKRPIFTMVLRSVAGLQRAKSLSQLMIRENNSIFSIC
jgi:hypothetical protein